MSQRRRGGVGAARSRPQARCGAVVTGGAGGLGRAIARVLRARGLQVWLADLPAAEPALAADEVGDGVHAAVLDVTDRDACRALAREVEVACGLAVWVNNAGILRTGPTWDHPPGEVAALFDVNVHGTIHGTTAALDVLRPAGVGHIVNVVSLAGLVAPPGEAMYAATKHAALAYTLGTAQDLRLAKVRGVRLTAVCPDGIWTPMLAERLDDPQAALSFQGGLLEVEQVAQVVGDALDRRSAVISVPRWRGGVARSSAMMPRVALALGPAVAWQARRAQRRHARARRR